MSTDPRAVTGRRHWPREPALQTFSPREVQARVRAGESAEAIAADTGWALDKVARYADPLLAERAYVAELAQSVEVRRSGVSVTLRESATAAVASTDLVWDAYRREDGRWIVTARFDDDGPHLAAWTYDHAGRNLHPQDDDARALMGARAPRSADLDDADIADALNLVAPIAFVRTEEDTPAEPGRRPRLVAVPDVRADAGDGAVDDDAAAAGDDDAAPGAVDDAAIVSANHPTISVPSPTPPPAGEQPTRPPAKRATRTRRAKAVPADPPADPPADDAPPPPPRKARPRKARASVPTWDEILFGSGKPDEVDR